MVSVKDFSAIPVQVTVPSAISPHEAPSGTACSRARPAAGPFPLLVTVALLAGVLAGPTGTASAETAPVGPLSVTQAAGSVEVLGTVWAPVKSGSVLGTALRTGTGRAVLKEGSGGTLTVASSSTLRVYQGQPDLQSGRFYISGPYQLYAFGTHMVSEGKVRLDAGASLQRVAVISGSLRISPGGRAVTLKTGQQYDFRSGRTSDFRENDPWYDSRFAGAGDAVLQASRGTVLSGPDADHLRPAETGLVLGSGDRLRTGAQAWAEIGFTGGGYLRLQAESQLRVMGVEKTDRGREVLLQLESGSAWNVVQRNQGGYQLSTPTVTTAVRGTVFRVDASGLVKVFDGSVSIPSQGDALLAQGRERATTGQVAPLTTDAQDSFNIARDAERARRTVLQVPTLRSLPDLKLALKSNPDAVVTVSIGGHDYVVTGQDGAYSLQQTLPEGRYTLSVRAARTAGSVSINQSVVIDRTPPELTVTSVRTTGHLLTVTGTVRDAFTARPLLRATLDGQTYSLHATGAFTWTLPVSGTGTPTLSVTAQDDTGNRSYAKLP
ncbi:hypothetical protein GCM10008939_02910 [Deinococcus aquiradiocola]|uniref:FecR protein domain-containing protein n=1 Tax=Deinococcus aquiradiocola TaxID=393059 RepID=A0A917P5F7_9DEIO|nr:hypothetical protein GCM10008939_02910 [Deinococcus aquiradiocola]